MANAGMTSGRPPPPSSAAASSNPGNQLYIGNVSHLFTSYLLDIQYSGL
jgi:hypothetical protein